MKAITSRLACFVLITQIVISAYAYDSTGHMIVQQIALRQLSPATATLDGDPTKRIVKHDYQNINERVKEIVAIDIGKVGSDIDFEAWAKETHQIADETAYGKLAFDLADKFYLSTSLPCELRLERTRNR